jgi:hypothetical protein
MLSRSYVQPSLATTGSVISPSEIGHLNSIGKISICLGLLLKRRVLCIASGKHVMMIAIRSNIFNMFQLEPVTGPAFKCSCE